MQKYLWLSRSFDAQGMWAYWWSRAGKASLGHSDSVPCALHRLNLFTLALDHPVWCALLCRSWQGGSFRMARRHLCRQIR